MTTCAVKGCPSRGDRCKDFLGNKIIFYRMPTNYEQQKLWVETISKGNGNPPEGNYICSIHFEDSAFDHTSSYSLRLKENAVPSISLLDTSASIDIVEPFCKTEPNDSDISIIDEPLDEYNYDIRLAMPNDVAETVHSSGHQVSSSKEDEHTDDIVIIEPTTPLRATTPLKATIPLKATTPLKGTPLKATTPLKGTPLKANSISRSTSMSPERLLNTLEKQCAIPAYDRALRDCRNKCSNLQKQLKRSKMEVLVLEKALEIVKGNNFAAKKELATLCKMCAANKTTALLRK